MKEKSESEVAQSCPTLSDPMAAAYQARPSMGFSRREYWSGVPSPRAPTNVELLYFKSHANIKECFIEKIPSFPKVNVFLLILS